MENIPYELIARYLAGECNDDEKQQVLEWIRKHPDIMDEFSKIWEQDTSKEFSPDVEQALQNVNQRIDTTKGRSKRMLLYMTGAVAAIAAVVVILISIVAPQNQEPPRNILVNSPLLTLNTEVNETREYQLPDGSKIWLNQSSSLKYPESFANDSREVYLEGEAFFDIAPNKEKPFIIHANNTQTRVVGTSFGIRAVKDADEVVVTVSTGIVNLSAEGKTGHIELKQGEQGLCKPEEKKLEKNNNPDPNLLAWKTKVLIFKQSPLTEVARIIEDAYHIPVTVDSSVAGLQITSTFDQRSLEEITQIIEITLQIKVEKSENGIIFR